MKRNYIKPSTQLREAGVAGTMCWGSKGWTLSGTQLDGTASNDGTTDAITGTDGLAKGQNVWDNEW